MGRGRGQPWTAPPRRAAPGGAITPATMSTRWLSSATASMTDPARRTAGAQDDEPGRPGPPPPAAAGVLRPESPWLSWVPPGCRPGERLGRVCRRDLFLHGPGRPGSSRRPVAWPAARAAVGDRQAQAATTPTGTSRRRGRTGLHALIVVAASVDAAVWAGRVGPAPASYGGGAAGGWTQPAPRSPPAMLGAGRPGAPSFTARDRAPCRGPPAPARREHRGRRRNLALPEQPTRNDRGHR